MDAGVVALVLAAAVLHAAWNVHLHGAEDRVAAMAMSGLVSAVALAPFLLVDPPSGLWVLVAVSGLAQAAYGLALANAYRRGQLSVTYPVGRGTAPLLAAVGAAAFVDQPLTPATVAGAVLVAVGLVLVAFRSHREGTLVATGLAVLVGIAIATYSVVDARAVREGAMPLAYLACTLGIEGIVMSATFGLDRPRMRAALRPGAAIALGSVAAYALILVAFERAPVGRVATLREVSVVIAIRMARERPGAIGWAGIALVLAGAALAAGW